MNKLTLKIINIIAAELPEEKYMLLENDLITGEDALLSGNKEINGRPVEKDKLYEMDVPIIREANHRSSGNLRRL